MESLGDYLKREREYRNISLEEISQITKIREDVLRALEEDCIDSSVPTVFVKGFLRAYARHVGLNPDEVVLRYEDAVTEEKGQRPKKGLADRPKQWIVKYIVFPVSTLALLGILLFLILNWPMSSEVGDESPQRSETVAPSTPQAESARPLRPDNAESVIASPPDRQALLVTPSPSQPPRPAPPPPPEATAGIELQLRALEDTWFRIQVDQQAAMEVLLRQGETISRAGETNIDMTIGNAGGLEIIHNGKKLGKLGKPGEVIHLSIGPGEVKTRRPGTTHPDTP